MLHDTSPTPSGSAWGFFAHFEHFLAHRSADPLPVRPEFGLALVALPSTLVSCRSDKAGGDTDPAAGANILTVTARDFAFDAPGEVPAGITTIRLVNQGPSLHHVQMLKLEEGKTLKDFLGALSGEQFPPWASLAGGPNPPEVGSTSATIQTLEPGTYALICLIPSVDGMPHVVKGMARELKVVGPSQAAGSEPEADIVVKLVDYDFELSKPITPGKHIIRVDNAGPQPHEIAIIRLNAGKSPRDFAAWGMKPVGPPPATIHGGVSGILPGSHVLIEVDLPSGEYGLLCFLPDSKDGKPHFEHGMAKQIKVSS
jgi:hypothetical protein